MNSLSNFDELGPDDNFKFKDEFFKYLYFWKFFLVTAFVFLFVAFLYLRYTPKVYSSTAKIKILDKKESSLEMPTASDLFSNSKINLENEIEVIKSYPILSQVSKNLNLYISVKSVGHIMHALSVDYPFDINLLVPFDSLSTLSFGLTLNNEGFDVVDYESDITYYFSGSSTSKSKHDLPFEIDNFDRNKFLENDFEGYEIELHPIESVVNDLKESIQIIQVGKESDIISLSYNSTNLKYAKSILNNIISVYNNDGIKDRQLIHKRTIDFVNDRYSYLSIELDSIEIAKQLYKVDNDLVDFTANSTISLQKSFKSEESIFSAENQISLTILLIETLDNSQLELLPANMGIENGEINTLISEYNQTILDRKKLVLSAGFNNPSVVQMDDIIQDTRSNIVFSLQSHLSQLKKLKEKLSKQFFKLDSQVSNLPEKEKILRAIERNQEIKEALYLYLLQRREEAQVSYAVTEPGIKVVEYAISNDVPISPKPIIIYLSSFLLALGLPFGMLYILFITNTKIYSKEDLENLKIGAPILAEIPEIVGQSNNLLHSSNIRSVLAESFRVLSSNLNFIIPKDSSDEGKVIILTSTIKGEGKSFCALNSAITYSSLNKKVLLIGADLHNPQLHKYLDVEKSSNGLSNFLIDSTNDWKKYLVKPKANFDILLGGSIPPNPAQLLSSRNFDKLLTEAKTAYDYIIIDSPPSLLVSDTLSIVHLSDVCLFVTRCNHSSKEVLKFVKDTISSKKIKNVGLILNGLGASNLFGFGYDYSNSFRYGYRYSYNYGYGYGYNSEDEGESS